MVKRFNLTARRLGTLCLCLAAWPGLGGLHASSDSALAPDKECESVRGNRIHSLHLSGLKHTRPEVVRRELEHAEGGAFSPEARAREQARLEDLDIFAQVAIHCPDSAGEVSLEYRFREMPPYIPFVSLVKTDQDGWSAGPALASLNFLGRDMRIELHSRFGGTTEFLVSLSSPWMGTWPVEYDIFAVRVDSYNPLDDFREESWRVGWELLYRLRPTWDLLAAGEIFHLESDIPEVLLNPQGDLIPRLGAGLVWDTRNRRLHPDGGFYREIRLTQSGGFLGGPANFQELLTDIRYYRPLGAGFKFHAAVLYQYRFGEMGREIGVYDDFHLGGPNSLRGYAAGALRGRNEMINTLESRYTLIPRRAFQVWMVNGYFAVEGILGVETAGVWDGNAVLPQKLHPAAYGGVHLLLAGVERIRLEVGSKSASADILFDVGVWEKSRAQRFRTR